MGGGRKNIFGNLSLHATFQNPRTTPSGIQVTGGEEERQSGDSGDDSCVEIHGDEERVRDYEKMSGDHIYD